MPPPLHPTTSHSSDFYYSDDSSFLEALANAHYSGGAAGTDPQIEDEDEPKVSLQTDTSSDAEPPPCAQPPRKRSRSSDIEDDDVTYRSALPALTNADGTSYMDTDTYGAAHFGDFGEYMSRKRAKLQVQNTGINDCGEQSAGKSLIFKGVAIYINGWTDPSVQDLRTLIIEHGGVFHAYLDKKALVTHIITCSLTPAKIREFQHMKVVKPDWLVESIKAGYLLPWQDFIFRAGPRVDESQGCKAAQTSLQGFAAPKNAKSKAPKTEETAHSSDILWNSSQADIDILPTSFDLSQDEGTPPTTPRKRKDLGAFIPHSTDPVSPAHAAKIPDYASRESNENAARVMANPAWRAAHTSVAPDFIEGFYKNSRLHHLSTWKAELKTLVAEAQEHAERGAVPGRADGPDGGVSMRGAELVLKNPLKGKGKEKAEKDKDRVIMHCDFDAFFVSAGLIGRPALKGKPIVVCHSQGAQGGASSTSEIASASYEARKFGIKNGMSLQQARKLCPQVQTIPYEFERYKEFSLKFYTILMSHADDLQAVSVDEALIEVTSTVSQIRVVRTDGQDDDEQKDDAAKQLAESIRTQVREATGCEVSIGIAHNIILARLATKRAKPAGSYHLRLEELPAFLSGLDIQDLHGFGWSTREKAQEKLGATNLGDLAKRSKATLCEALGKGTGETLYNAIRGIDERKLESDKPRRSVSCEINYGIRFESNEQAETFMFQMAEEVTRRLNAVNMKGKSLTLKVLKRDPSAPVEPPKFMGHGLCLWYSRQSALAGSNGRATDNDKVIGALAWKLLKSLDIPPHELRGLGIQIQKLEAEGISEPEPGQARLPFKPVESPQKAGPSKLPPVPEIRVVSASQEGAQGEDLPHVAEGTNLDLPSFSQVDMAVFGALPDDVRQELEAEYKRRSASPALAVEAPGRSVSPAPAGVKSPSGLRVKGVQSNLARITLQLAPRSKPTVAIAKDRLFRVGRSSVRIREAELLKLGIDPTVFAVLPPDIQREQIAQARVSKAKGSFVSVKPLRAMKPPKRIKADSKYPPAEIIPPPPPPKAHFVAPPVLRQPGVEKGQMLAFWEGDDIQRLVEQWVEGFSEHAPHRKDVEYFAKFLIRSVETDAGVEKAVSVMRWWMVLLRRVWGVWEYAGCDSESDDELRDDPRLTSERVGRAWWDAFRDVKRRMDEVTKKRFGGTLSIK
ncbi:hypothetical protein EWM64_g2367 [Hericium alpestre]|uniref:DNA repair protein REV1 n=1 Tax=Hericium alpestre TaxID=135208 RepID=A0A4Z0A5N0_9AGAM|nr:hypothetical protein EWM64_g2367 [Hericium alpestre]